MPGGRVLCWLYFIWPAPHLLGVKVGAATQTARLASKRSSKHQTASCTVKRAPRLGSFCKRKLGAFRQNATSGGRETMRAHLAPKQKNRKTTPYKVRREAHLKVSRAIWSFSAADACEAGRLDRLLRFRR